MNDLQKMGGVAALIQAAAYVVGFGLALTLLAPVLDADPDQYGAFLVDNLTLMHIWQEKSVLRWGGLAGILGGIIFILVFALVIAFVGADPAQPEGDVMRFPDIRAARTVEDGLCLLVLILWVAHFLALYRALRERPWHRGSGRTGCRSSPACRYRAYLRPLPCPRCDPRGSGDTRPHVAG